MPFSADYKPARDPQSWQTPERNHPAQRVAVITPGSSELTLYPKSLMCFVPTGTASPTVSIRGLGNLDADTAVQISLPEGMTILPVSVRFVTAAASGVIVYGLYD